MSPEEIENLKSQLEEQNRESKYLSEKEKNYRERTSNNNLVLNLKWQDKITEIDKDFLFRNVVLEGFNKLEENFTVVYLNIDRILKNYSKDYEKIFPTNKLWDTNRNNRKITKLILYIEEGNTLCPPIIDLIFNEYTKSEVIIINDGNHRIALSRFLKYKKIPFIIRKEKLIKIKNI